MRYLRMLTNAVASGVLGAGYLSILVLQLNPQVPLISWSAVNWFGVLVRFYGLYLSAIVYLILLVRETIAARPLQPAWLSVKLLAWFGAMLSGAAAVLTWANLRGFRAVLDDGAFARARTGATATTICAAVLLIIAIVRYSFLRRGGRPAGVVLAITIVLSVGVPLWARGPGDIPAGDLPGRVMRGPTGWPTAAGATAVADTSPGQPTPYVRLIVLDGASRGFITERVAAGRLPNLGRVLDRGAVMDLATLKPTQPDPIWAAAATGKYPPKDGVRSAATYRARAADPDVVDLLPDYCFAYALPYLGLVKEEGLTSAALHARPFWDILADYGIAVGIVRWPLTFPAHALRGYVISDRFDLAAMSPLRSDDAQAGAPTSAVEIARDLFDAFQFGEGADAALASAPVDPAIVAGTGAARWDRPYSEAAVELDAQFAPRLTAVRYLGIDVVAHKYLRYAEPGLFGDVRAEDQQRYGGVLDAYYAYVDDQIGRAMASLGPGDLLLVVSGFGMDPETLPKRLLARALDQPERSGTHEAAPDGFLLAYGSNVAPGQLPRGAIVDLAPTVLYYMGVPVGRDMDGYARADLFASAFTFEHPIALIPSHEK